MSQRALTLPIRTLIPRSSASQWICRRCLATQTQSHPTASTSNDYRSLQPTEILSKKLPQPMIPAQYLAHVNAENLPISEQIQWEKTSEHKKIVGVVVSHGKMNRTVRVRVAGQRWNNKIKKYYRDDTNHLVHDPNNSLVTGDVVELHRLHVSRHVEHVVGAIVSPFGKSIRERPPIPTPEERLAEYKQKRFLKLERRELRARAAEGDAEAIKRLTEMGLDPGNGAQAGVGRKVNAQHGVGKQRDPSSGAILGSKGQKLPKGVLPGGEHEVGKINDRSRHNKEKAMKFEQKSEQRLLEAKEKGEELAQQGLASRR